MNELLIPFGTWPKTRDPDLPPFLVEEYYRSTYRIVGTFRTGVVSLCAVPLEYKLANERFEDLFVALTVARHLNDLHARGEINWEPEFPVLKNTELASFLIRTQS